MSNYINNIEIKNFKSIRHQKIDGCKRINVFIGYPNVGKSNILEAMSMFCPLLLQYNYVRLNFKNICRLKEVQELFYNHDAGSVINIEINNKIASSIIIDESNSISITYVDNIDDVNSEKSWTINTDDRFNFQNFDFRGAHDFYQIKKYIFPWDVEIDYKGPVWLNVPFGGNLLSVLKGQPSLREEFGEVFKGYHLKFAIDNANNSIVLIKELNDGLVALIPYHQIADTLRRLMFYKTAIVSNKESVLLFEEPEAHMFPPYITRFAGDIMHDDNKNQFFLNTHSPFVLNEFLENAKNDLSVYVVDYKNGETIIKRLRDKELDEIYEYGVDLFFNLESYLA